MNKMDFSVPKHYVDYEDEFDMMEDAMAFVSANQQEDYVASLLFYQSPVKDFSRLDPEASETFTRAFTESFLGNIRLSEYEKTKVQGRSAHRFMIHGWLDKNHRSAQCSFNGDRQALRNKGSSCVFLS